MLCEEDEQCGTIKFILRCHTRYSYFQHSIVKVNCDRIGLGTAAFILMTASANIFAILIAFGSSNIVQINWEQFKHGSNSVFGTILLSAFFIANGCLVSPVRA